MRELQYLLDHPQLLNLGGKMEICQLGDDHGFSEFDKLYRASIWLGNAGMLSSQHSNILLEVKANIPAADSDWNDQKVFLSNFIRSFYSAYGVPNDTIGWVHIRYAATPFNKLNNEELFTAGTGKITEKMDANQFTKKERTSDISLNGIKLDLSNVSMLATPGSNFSHLKLWQKSVQRTFNDTSAGAKVCLAREKWYFWSEPDIKRYEYTDKTSSPVSETFINPHTKMQEIILLCLSRLNKSGKIITQRCVGISPLTGAITDLRECEYSLEYYLKVNLNNYHHLAIAISKNGKIPIQNQP